MQAQYDYGFTDGDNTSTFGFNRSRIGVMGNIPYDFSYYVLLDGVLLCLILSPLLFRYVYKPMRNSVKELDEARRELKFTIQELAVALTEVKQLRGIIPICATCKKIRNDEGLWQQIEAYIVEHSDADFSHSICPDCAALVYEKLEQLDKKEK